MDASPLCWGAWLPSGKARGENKGAFQGNQKQPDILITQTGAQPVVIENEYFPANTVEVEARDRLGENLDAGVVMASGKVNAVIALRSPVELRYCAGLDEVDKTLKEGVTLEYALFTGSSDVDSTRFPKLGFIKGSIRDLAAFIEYASTPEDAVQRAVMILEEGVQDAAATLRQAAELSEDTQASMSRTPQAVVQRPDAAHGGNDCDQRPRGPPEPCRSARREEPVADRSQQRSDTGQRAGGVAKDTGRQLLVDIQHRERAAALHQPS